MLGGVDGSDSLVPWGCTTNQPPVLELKWAPEGPACQFFEDPPLVCVWGEPSYRSGISLHLFQIFKTGVLFLLAILYI